LTNGKKHKKAIISWKKELLLTTLMLGLVSFFAYWQIIDHLRLRREQQKIITFLNNDISTALAGILNSQPRFGAIVLKDSIAEKVTELMNSGKGDPVIGVTFLNSKGQLLFTIKKVVVPTKWYMSSKQIGPTFKVISRPYAKIAKKSGMGGSSPIIGNKATVIAMINLISSSSEEQSTTNLSPGGTQIGDKVKKILSEKYFKDKSVAQVVYLLDVDFLYQTISKDLILRCIPLLFCLIAFSVFTYSLFNLKPQRQIKNTAGLRAGKTIHFQEMHLVAAGLAHEIKNPLNSINPAEQNQ
jgi:hypothetical protein